MVEKGGNTILWVLGLLGIVSVVSKGSTAVVENVVSNINLIFDKVTFAVKGINVEMTFFFKIRNENPVGGRINSFNGNVYLQNKLLGPMSINNGFDIAANSTTDTISSVVSYSLISAGGIIIDGIRDGNTSSDVRIVGELSTSYGTYSIDQIRPLLNV